jgi:signal transduction histidine kinase
MWAPLSRRPKDEVDDGVTYGGHGWLRRRPVGILKTRTNPAICQSSASEVESGGVLVAVGDSGPGLPPANPERIFEAFHTTKAIGLGMGLSICRSIVEAHDGRLWAMPNEPHGAVFCMMLPAAEKPLEKLGSSNA